MLPFEFALGVRLLAWFNGGFMGVSEILASVDREIALLKQVRALLAGTAAVTA